MKKLAIGADIGGSKTVGLNNLAGIGFAMPGPFDYPNGIQRKNRKQVLDVKEMADLAKTDSKISGLFEKFGENLGAFLIPWIENLKLCDDYFYRKIVQK